MEHLSVDTVPLTVVPGTGRRGPAFTVHVDELAGTVTVHPSDS
ncbi:hypothetical protein [Curtobacterium sp. L1-20]|jgi:hypothetical protein